jgi:hypothetical protein
VTPEQAALEYWQLVEDVDAAKPMLSRFEKACGVLKKHMSERSIATFKGIKLESFSRGRRLDMALLTQTVDPELVESCKTEQTAYRLLPWRRPKAAAKPAA